MSVFDRCANCEHPRGLHRPHCRKSGHGWGRELVPCCDCLGFVESETQAVLSSPAGEPWWV